MSSLYLSDYTLTIYTLTKNFLPTFFTLRTAAHTAAPNHMAPKYANIGLYSAYNLTPSLLYTV